MQTLTANGIQIAYDEAGQGEPVVLIGGGGMPSKAWDFSIKPTLVEAGYRVVTFDNRGCGDSEAPRPPYTIADMALDTSALMEQLDITPCYVVGLSLGGFIAEELCHQRPDLVRAVVLLASCGRTTAYMHAKMQAEHEMLVADGQLPVGYERIDALTVALPPAVLQNDDETVRAWQQLLDSGTGYPTEAGQRGQEDAMRQWLLDEHRTERWTQLHTPCQVVAFEHDLQFPPSRAREAAHTFAHGAFIEIPGVGHGNGPFDAAAETSQTVIEFFAEPSS